MNLTRIIACRNSLVKVVVEVLTLFVCVTQFVVAQENDRTASYNTLRVIESGDIIGFADPSGNNVWLGVPFARPPMGDYRWRAPRQPESWAGVREALDYSSVCSQLGTVFGGASQDEFGQLIGSEDCLYLNIWVPQSMTPESIAAGERLPVMLWIHGGGNRIGAGSTFQYAEALASKHELVVVTINYRLGPFGWFLIPEINEQLLGSEAQRQQEDLSGNYGTLDIIESLRWVQRNIENFGGDKDRVTIFGESAGGQDVYSMLVSPVSEGLFHRAISQSGGVLTISAPEASNYLDDEQPGHFNSSGEITLELAILENNLSDRNVAKSWVASQNSNSLSEWLRAKSSAEVFGALKGEGVDYGVQEMPNVIRDGYVIPAVESWELYTNHLHDKGVPLIAGTNRDEVKLQYSSNPDFVDASGAVPRIKDVGDYTRVTQYISKLWRTFGTDLPSRNITQAGGAPVYAYRFDYDQLAESPVFSLKDLLGAHHGAEIAYAFGAPPQTSMRYPEEYQGERNALADAMSSYWANFAYTGAPGRGREGNLPVWQAWSNETEGPKLQVFASEEDGGIHQISSEATITSVIAEMENDAALAGDGEATCYLISRVFADQVGDWAINSTSSQIIENHRCN